MDMTDAMLRMLERQRQAFVAEGPPGVAARRNRIDHLLALVLDHTDEFVDAMAEDYGTRPRAGSDCARITGGAAPPFTTSMRAMTALGLRTASIRTRRRLRRR